VADTFDRLKTTLADRYEIERRIGITLSKSDDDIRHRAGFGR
jgi:hypothetical protein